MFKGWAKSGICGALIVLAPFLMFSVFWIKPVYAAKVGLVLNKAVVPSGQYAQLNLSFKTQSAHTPPSGYMDMWVVNIYNGTSTSDPHLTLGDGGDKPLQKAYVAPGTALTTVQITKDQGIGWKSSTNSGDYLVILDLRECLLNNCDATSTNIGHTSITFNTGTIAQATQTQVNTYKYNPTLQVVISVGETADSSGDLYPRMDLNWTPPSNLSTYKNTSGATQQYHVIIKEGATSDVDNNYDSSTSHAYYMNKPGAIVGMIEASPWLAWKHTYTATLELKYGDTVIGSTSKTITVNIPPGQDTSKDSAGKTNTQSGTCPIPSSTLKWYPINNVVNDIVFVWGKPNCADAASGNLQYKVSRPDGTAVSSAIQIWGEAAAASHSGNILTATSNYSIEDSAAQTGWYMFTTYNSGNVQVGSQTAYVDLAKATVQTSDGDKPVSSLAGSNPAANPGSVTNCSTFWANITYIPSAMFQNFLKYIVCEFAQIPIAIGNWIGNIFNYLTI